MEGTVASGSELYVFDPALAGSETNPQIVADIRPGSSSGPEFLTESNDKLYFQANDGTSGLEMWVYDPAVATSVSNPSLVFDLSPGSGSGEFQQTAVIGDKIYYKSNTPATGDELFVFDTSVAASETNPSLVYDLNVGASSADPSYLEVHNGKIYFTADTPTTGTELYAFDPALPASETNPLIYELEAGVTSTGLYSIRSVGSHLYVGVLLSGGVGYITSFDDSQAFDAATNPLKLNPVAYDDWVYDIR